MLALYERAKKMPPPAPASLDEKLYLDVLAYVLQVNGGESGEKALPQDAQTLGSLSIP